MMPVRKFRSVEEMPDPAVVVSGSAEHWRRVARVWHRAVLLARRRRVPGVRRFRSVTDPSRAVPPEQTHAGA
jgi:hypothetical protein